MNQKRVAMTGSTHGIGRGIALRLLEAGYEVYGCAHTEGDPNIARLETHHKYHHAIVDVAREDEVSRWLQTCGSIDAAINCAGTGCIPRAVDQMRDEDARRVVDVNLFGTAYSMKYELPLLRHGGILLNVGSISATTPGTGADWSYSASKAGVAALTREAALRPENGSIHFALLTLGYIETRMTAADDKQLWLDRTPHRKAGRPEEVAELVMNILKNPIYGEFREYTMVGGGYFDKNS